MILEYIRIFLPFVFHLPLVGYLLRHWYRSQVAAPLRSYFWIGVSVKGVAGIIVGWLYLYYYPYRGDTWVLFDESVLLSKLAFDSPTDYLRTLFLKDVAHAQHYVFLTLSEQPRAFFMAKLLSVINLFTFHNYWITGSYCSLFSFWGLWTLANRLAVCLPATRLAAAVACLLVPSVVFWSSGVLKESIAVGCLGAVVAWMLGIGQQSVSFRFQAIRPLVNRSFFGQAVCYMLALWILWQLKFYYVGALVPAGIAWIVSMVMHVRYPAVSLRLLRGLQLLVYISVFNAVPLVYEWLTGQSLLESLVANHDATIQASQPGTFVIFSSLQATFSGFLRHFPLALWSGLFAPLPWQAHGWLALGISLENSLVLIAFAGYIWTCFQKRGGFANSEDTIFNALLRQSLWLYCGSLAIILALASPNFGALSRYKVGFWPFFVFLLASRLFLVKNRKLPVRT